VIERGGRTSAPVITLVLCLPAPVAADEPNVKALSKILVGLRSEVDDLDSQLRSERTQNLVELRTLERRREELALLRDGEAVKQATLKQQLDRRRARQTAEQDVRTTLTQAVERGIDGLVAALQRSLPYRREERLAELATLRLRLRAGRVDPTSAAVKLWRLSEDELRLSMTVELAEVPLLIEGKRRLVRGAGGDWRHLLVTDRREREQIAALFRALERQVREGAYRLPLPPLSRGGRP